MDYSISEHATGRLFSASGDGTAPLQLQFCLEAEKFLYLRKGEWGVGELVVPVMAWVQQVGWEALTTSADVGAEILKMAKGAGWESILPKIAVATLSAEMIIASVERSARRITSMVRDLSDWIRGQKPPSARIGASDARVICTAGKSDSALPFCVRANMHVRQYIDPGERSRHRYYVNEKHFCLFLALGRRKYIGWYGDDPQMIDALRKDFEREWQLLGEDAQVA